MCEVIEHLARWPADVLRDIRAALKPGGLLLVTTQNLHRLSQRLRMLSGRRLFAHYVRENLVMAHLREYTPEELVYLCSNAQASSGRIPDCWRSRIRPDPHLCRSRTAWPVACSRGFPT